LRISDDRKIKMDIPVTLVGVAPGVSKGGSLVRKRASLKVYGFFKDMPDHIDVDVSGLDFHHAVKVGDMQLPGLEFLDPKAAAIAAVEVNRAAKLAAEEAAKAAETAAAAPKAAAPAAAAAKAAPAKKDEGKK
jgi:large subunit ribosomal protein L25